MSSTAESKALLNEAAYSEYALPALRLARSSRIARLIAKCLVVLLMLTFVIVAFAPWQQSIKGSGKVIAYAPFERQQVVEAPIKGRIIRLGDGIVENAFVTKGQLIAEIADMDPEYLGRLESQLEAAERQVEAAEMLVDANERSLIAAHQVVTSFEAQIRAYEQVKSQVIAAADADVLAAENKLEAEKTKLVEYQAALRQIEADWVRQKKLFEEKIVSELTFQEAERKKEEFEAKVEGAQAYIRAAQNEIESKMSEREAKAQKAQVDIDYATGIWQKSTSDVAKAESEVAKAEAELTKALNYRIEMQTKVARQRNQLLTAPCDGYITEIAANQGSQILSEGDPICTIVPQTNDRAVQLWLDGNDAPLVEPGRHVRLQFEGWPGVQFAGWPSVAVGTFGGEVISVDATDDGNGKFRILIQPDDTDRPWPEERYLRQGVRANGWVLLERVPLWYEVWRNMNGFPPAIRGQDSDVSDKTPKLPKP